MYPRVHGCTLASKTPLSGFVHCGGAFQMPSTMVQVTLPQLITSFIQWIVCKGESLCSYFERAMVGRQLPREGKVEKQSRQPPQSLLEGVLLPVHICAS